MGVFFEIHSNHIGRIEKIRKLLRAAEIAIKLLQKLISFKRFKYCGSVFRTVILASASKRFDVIQIKSFASNRTPKKLLLLHTVCRKPSFRIRFFRLLALLQARKP